MLDAQDLAARRGPVRLFAGLGFAFGAGEALVVTGANGRGKTTLLRILAGLSEPEAGTIRLDGRVVGPHAVALRRAVAFAGHAVALKDEFSVRENLVVAGDARGRGSGPARDRRCAGARGSRLARRRCRRGCCPRASAGASTSRASRWCRGACGSWTNR